MVLSALSIVLTSKVWDLLFLPKSIGVKKPIQTKEYKSKYLGIVNAYQQFSKLADEFKEIICNRNTPELIQW